jgi:alpha-beta hydrolase superfamily lysophospholipase
MENYETAHFLSHNGTCRLTMRLYLPEGPPVAIFQIVHGMAEHMGRYHALAKELQAAGFVVCIHDQAGHGASIGRGTPGFIAARRGDRVLIADALRCGALVKARFSLPLVLMGHSMGSFIASRMVALDPHHADALVLMGTGGPNPALLGGWLVASACCLLGLGRRANPFIAKLLSRVNNRGIPHPDTELDWLSYNKANVAAYQTDPFCGFAFTSAGYRDLFRLMRDAGGAATFAAIPKKLPVLLISGAEDPVGDFGDGVRAVAEAYGRAGCTDVDLVLLPYMRHEPLGETDAARVHSRLRDWALSKLPPDKPAL